MNMKDSIQTCFTKYIDFTGRAVRSEYWWFVLFCLILELIAYPINQNIYYLVVLILFLPSLAVLVRRLHDTDHTGWWALIVLIPIIGFLVILYFMIIEGTPGPNTYGPPAIK